MEGQSHRQKISFVPVVGHGRSPGEYHEGADVYKNIKNRGICGAFSTVSGLGCYFSSMSIFSPPQYKMLFPFNYLFIFQKLSNTEKCMLCLKKYPLLKTLTSFFNIKP